MNKTQLIQATSWKAENSKETAAKNVNALLEVIVQTLKKGESIVIPGFGSFSIKERAARKGFNPATKEAVEIAAKKVIKFKPSEKMLN